MVKKINDCVFCKIDKIRKEGEILFESPNFYVKIASFGAMGPGHILMVPKTHIRCYGEMKSKYDSEFLELGKKIKVKINKSFSQDPITCEMGIFGQSVKHAHMHFILPRSESYEIKGMLSDYLPLEVETSKIYSLNDLRYFFEREEEYIYLNQNEVELALKTKNYCGKGDIRLRGLFVKATGLEELTNWKEMPNKFLKRNDEWIAKTLSYLKE